MVQTFLVSFSVKAPYPRERRQDDLLMSSLFRRNDLETIFLDFTLYKTFFFSVTDDEAK